MELFFFVHVVAFVSYLVTYGLLYARNRTEKLNRDLRLFLLNLIGWVALEFTFFLEASRGRELLIWRLASIFWIPSVFWFLNFVYRLTGKARDWLYWLSLALAALGVVAYIGTDLGLTGYTRHAWGVVGEPGPAYPIFVGVPFFHAVGAIWMMVRHARVSGASRGRTFERSLKLIAAGGVATFGAAVMINVVLPSIPGIGPVPRLASCSAVLLLPFLDLAVLRHGFLSVSVGQAVEELFEGLRDGVVLLDRQGTARRANRAARELLDLDEGDDAASALEELLAGRPEGVDLHEVKVGRDGSEQGRVLSISKTATRRRGIEFGSVVTIHDLTERRRFEEVLRRSRDELEERVAERARELREAQKMEVIGAMAGGIAHDFNNLLAAIVGFASAARDDLDEEHPNREDVEEILIAAGRGRDIVRHLLDFGHGADIEPRRLDLSSLARETLRLVEVSLPPGVSLDFDGAGREIFVYGDAAQLHQVVMNLCTNACQAMARSGGELKVSLRRVSREDGECPPDLEPGGYGLLEVCDEGEGISAETMDRIFEPFFTTRGGSGGTGLGLATAVRIVEGHGGRLAVESEPGRGSVFSVYIPEAGSESAEESEADLPAVRGDEKILFVDDKQQMVRMGRRLLESLGYSFAGFTSPSEALSVFRQRAEAFDLAIVDLRMPGMTGIELAAGLREVEPELPVVLVSGNASPEDLDSARRAGVAAFLGKPLAKGRLAEAVRELLDRSTRR
ncbi:MAG: response regulator [Polyangia bacterium]